MTDEVQKVAAKSDVDLQLLIDRLVDIQSFIETDYQEKYGEGYLDNIELREDMLAFDAAIKAMRFKEYFDDLYRTGLEVANWHLNGDTEPFDTFYDNAIEWGEKHDE